MIKGTILSIDSFTSKNGNTLTSLTVLFENKKVAKVLVSGTCDLKENDKADFTVVPFGKYMSASVALVK